MIYWEIGKTILRQQKKGGWGAKVIDNLSRDLREEFPDFKGLSIRNLKYMRRFVDAYPGFSIVQAPLAQIPISAKKQKNLEKVRKVTLFDKYSKYSERGHGVPG